MTDLTGNVCAVVTTEVLQKVLKNDYGFINGEVQQLDGYDDKNFRITKVDKCIEGIEFPPDGIVIKFINSIDSTNLPLLEAQTKISQHLENSGINCPVLVTNKYGKSHGCVVIDNKTHAVLVYKYLSGEMLKKLKINSEISSDIGYYVGHLTSVLKEFNHEGFHRTHLWALENSAEVLKFVDVFDQEKQRQIITTVLIKFQSDVLLKADRLEKSIIHGDLNVSNIIVKNEKIHAVIDLGDVTYSFTIFDFTIALCYLILFVFEDDNAKLSDVHIKSFVDAYEKKYKRFNDSELSIIHISVCARICQSLVLGKKSSLRDPSNLYVLSTQKTGWKALEELMNIQGDIFIKLLRN